MTVLQKIKRCMGIASTKPVTNTSPPLRFHRVRGANIRVSRLGNLAERCQGFHKGITFSDRPVNMKERIFIKIAKLSKNWQGGIRFGFTNNDPCTLEGSLPKCSVPNLTIRPGFWAKKLEELNCERDDVLFFYVTSGGDVHFGVNGKQKGLFISGIDTRLPLWAIIDVYGNCTAVELLDWRVPEHKSIKMNNAIEMDQILPKMMQSMSVMERPTPTAAMVHAHSNSSLRIPCKPMQFHRTRGRNVVLSSDNLIATRVEVEFCQGYVFTARPIRIGEKLIVQVLRTDPRCAGGLALGLTSCDPATLRPSDLPDDSDLLLDRPEYWVVSKDVASHPVRGDEFIFCIMPNGEVQISKNNGPPTIVMHVDQSLTLWAFLDVYGSTQSVRVLSHVPAPPSSQHYQSPISASTTMLTMQRPMSQRFPSQVLPPAESVSSIETIHQPPPMPLLNQSRIQSTISHAAPTPNRVISSSEMIQLQSGGTVLVVNLPPATSNTNLTAPIQTSTPNTRPSWSHASLAAQWQEESAASLGPGVECSICYEKPIDSALYACGHMCMCYDCAVKQWHSVAGGGQCPLCRATIRDVLRIYKS